MVLCFVLLFILRWCFEHEQTRVLRVYVLDVGQGDAVLVVAPNGNTLLYDSGPPGEALLRELDTVLPRRNAALDVVVASHPDADHIGGFLGLKTRYHIGQYIDSTYFHPSSLFADTQEYLSVQSRERFRVQKKSYISLGAGVFVSLSSVQQGGTDANNGSIIMQVFYGKSHLLCTGDMDSHSEEKLVNMYGTMLQSTILKAGHHGAKTSNSESLLRVVSPHFVAISAGKNNSYGHPHVPALARMAYVRAQIFETRKEGRLVFECTIERCNKKSSP
jgi:beta-lactamase superfamily II metal-dependent hydrolase